MTGAVTLKKLNGLALSPKQIGGFDYVLLNHDHHFDNLDRAGRSYFRRQKRCSRQAKPRLDGDSRGFKDWQSVDVPALDGRVLRIVATPARHGPAGLDRGAVCGFVLFFTDSPEPAIYITGDTVWYEGVAELLHLGAARAPIITPFHLTMTAKEGVDATSLAFRSGAIVPIHFEDWAHFSEGPDALHGHWKRPGWCNGCNGQNAVERFRSIWPPIRDLESTDKPVGCLSIFVSAAVCNRPAIHRIMTAPLNWGRACVGLRVALVTMSRTAAAAAAWVSVAAVFGWVWAASSWSLSSA